MPTEDFDDIRPFRDAEVRPAVERLLADKRLFRIIGRAKFPRLYRALPGPLQGFFTQLLRRLVGSRLSGLYSLDDVQNMVFGLMKTTVARTTSGLTYSGLEQLDADKAYLFISNHRDIAMDPALVNFALKSNGFQYVEIAIGDNLLEDSLVADVMRLNRSFTVRRSVEGLKARLMAFNRLSAYISNTLINGRSVWLAQREGRAKNGLDKTDPAIIKMLNIYGKKQGLDFSESIRCLNIVPVAIAYEYDPCDLQKAQELHASETALYLKQEGEDIANIIRGITSPKGRVHIGFGTPLLQDFVDADAVAAGIDQQIMANYQLFPSNIVAFEQLGDRLEAFTDLHEEMLHSLWEWAKQARNKWMSRDQAEFKRHCDEFSERIARCPEKLRHLVLEMYANPLINQQKNLTR